MIPTSNIMRSVFTRRLLTILLLVAAWGMARAQLAVKTNLLYDATTTPNLGLEYGVGSRSTVNLVYGLNPFEFGSDADKKMVKHWVLMPEYRWWLCTRFSGHFLGVHAMTGQFDASNVSLPIPGAFFGGNNIASGVKDTRYEGTFAGIGATYGYQWILGRHFNLEAEIGVGYNHVWYDRYACGICGPTIGKGGTNYLGVTKIGVSFLYLF